MSNALNSSFLIESANLDDLTYQRIRQMILDGTLELGQQIVQDDIAKAFGVSRTPVRKALTRLEHEQLVTINTRGTFVRKFERDELIALFEIRAVLEGLAARLVARTIDEQRVNDFRSLFVNALKDSKSDGYRAYRDADREFHYFLATNSSNKFLIQTLNSIQILTVTFSQGLIRLPNETHQEHLAILDALSEHDAHRAERLAHQHINSTVEYLRRVEE